MSNNVTISGSIRVNAYTVVERAVEEGVELGCNRAHKYADKPTRESLADAIELAVMNELCEVLRFDD